VSFDGELNMPASCRFGEHLHSVVSTTSALSEQSVGVIATAPGCVSRRSSLWYFQPDTTGLDSFADWAGPSDGAPDPRDCLDLA